MTTAPRETARYRTKTSGLALPAAAIDFGVPIYCGYQTFELTNDGGFADTHRSAIGPTFEVTLLTEKTVLIQATFKFNVVHSVGRAYAYAVTGYIDPGVPEDQFGNLQAPRSTGRFTTLADENFRTLSTTIPWTGVVSRPPGPLTMSANLGLSVVGGLLADHGSITTADVGVFIAVVVGTNTDDECLQWGVST